MRGEWWLVTCWSCVAGWEVVLIFEVVVGVGGILYCAWAGFYSILELYEQGWLGIIVWGWVGGCLHLVLFGLVSAFRHVVLGWWGPCWAESWYLWGGWLVVHGVFYLWLCSNCGCGCQVQAPVNQLDIWPLSHSFSFLLFSLVVSDILESVVTHEWIQMLHLDCPTFVFSTSPFPFDNSRLWNCIWQRVGGHCHLLSCVTTWPYTHDEVCCMRDEWGGVWSPVVNCESPALLQGHPAYGSAVIWGQGSTFWWWMGCSKHTALIQTHCSNTNTLDSKVLSSPGLWNPKHGFLWYDEWMVGVNGNDIPYILR